MTELAEKYSIGSGIVEKHEAKILADLPTMYPDEGRRQVVEGVLLPHFRAELAKVFSQFVESEAVGLDRPIAPSRLSGLCGVVDEMIEKNRTLLDLDGMFKPLMERINAERAEVANALKEQFYQHCREILAGHGVTDRRSLSDKGPMWFVGTDFSPYGKGKAFARKILGEAFDVFRIADFERISDVLGFEKLSTNEGLQKYREAFAVHGVTDRQTLLRKGSVWFVRTSFPPYGKGLAFAGEILGETLYTAGIADLNRIADALGFEKLSREDELRQYREVLVGYDVADKRGLLRKGAAWFMRTKFLFYGKGVSFARKILGRVVTPPVRVADLEEISDILGLSVLSEKSKELFREALGERGVVDRRSLLSKGVVWFMKTDFSPYGKGLAFAGEILGGIFYIVTVADLNRIADVLGFEKPSREDELQGYREVLARHGITDRQSLLGKGIVWFKRADFSPHGGACAFAAKILGRHVASCIHIADVEEIADVLGFEKPPREEELQKYREVLARHGVIDRQGLVAKGFTWFLAADFPPYGKGTAFAREILKDFSGRISIASLERIADVLGLPVLSENNKELFREVLRKHGIVDRQSLFSKSANWFRSADFPPYGKGSAFSREILGRSAGSRLHASDLDEIAEILFSA